MVNINELESLVSQLTGQLEHANLEHNLQQLTAIGRTADNGVTRLAYSAEENKAHDYIQSVLCKQNIPYHVDSVGNLYATIKGQKPWKPMVMFGSHLDTVNNGGNYDGVVGVVGGLEALRVIQEYNNSNIPLERTVSLVVFRAEESTRFKKALIGSSLATGLMDPTHLNGFKDEDEIKLATAMKECGFDPFEPDNNEYEKSILASSDIGYFIEMHIEQGRVLEYHNLDIGIVTAIAAPIRYEAVVKGRFDHSGATPMNLRQDAITGTCEMILKIENLANQYAELGSSRATVGVMRPKEPSMNKVSGETYFTIDIRGTDREDRNSLRDSILKSVHTIASNRNLGIWLRHLNESNPLILSTEVQKTIIRSCDSLDIAYLKMPSGAGHDAMNMAAFGISTGMIFVPSKDGISHHYEEYTSIEQILAGTKVLLASIYQLASI